MLVLKETTKWPGNTPNNIYITSNDKTKLYGYISMVNLKPVKCKKPMTFETRNRTFNILRKV